MNNQLVMNIKIQTNINHAELISDKVMFNFYDENQLNKIIYTTLSNMIPRLNTGLSFPYFQDVDFSDFFNADSIEQPKKTIELDIYITEPAEGRQLNHESRDKDYATNILSYPSDLPADVLGLLPCIPLGELVICHEVVERQALEQDKTVNEHLTHLLVHGTLHLLGFDHELGEDERLEMEGFEIEILKTLGIENPYRD